MRTYVCFLYQSCLGVGRVVLKRPLGGKETFPVHRVETCHSVCTGYDGGGKSKVVALSWSEQEGVLTQERKGFGLPYQQLQPLAWLVEGLQAVEVGVLVEDKLEAHVCPGIGLPCFLISIIFPMLQLLRQARELLCRFLTSALFLFDKVLLQVE